MSLRITPFRHSPLILALGAALLLAGCGSKKTDDADPAESDPALTGALGDQIMVDPDLTGQNRGNSAISGGGPASAELPPQAKSPEAIAAARAEAAQLAGGTIQPAPAPGAAGNASDTAATAGQLASILPADGGKQCADKVDYSAVWATKLPATFPVYPRGHVQEAAGTDKDGCSLRVVNFITPVPVKDVVDFYYTRAKAGGFDAEHSLEGKSGTDHVLGGSKGAAAYIVTARSLANGLTEVDLVANGG
ncbi:MAG: hypothetical protein KGL44_06230 [Sphingomonadales bacterium]|nr:hypothetical protein [Sphingomonadales bacterium]